MISRYETEIGIEEGGEILLLLFLLRMLNNTLLQCGLESRSINIFEELDKNVESGPHTGPVNIECTV